MSKKTTIFTVIAAIVLLGAVVAIAMNAPDKEAPDTSNQTVEATQQSEESDETPAATDEAVAATISYTNNGFEPSTLTVKSGDTLRVENKSSSSLSFNSGDHPTHTKDGELNIGDVPKGQSKTFKVTTAGVWSFHNHDDATHEGTLTVQ